MHIQCSITVDIETSVVPWFIEPEDWLLQLVTYLFLGLRVIDFCLQIAGAFACSLVGQLFWFVFNCTLLFVSIGVISRLGRAFLCNLQVNLAF